MSVIQVGLTDATKSVDPQLLQSAAAALNIQVMRDLPQFWDVKATVRSLPNPKSIPVGVWPVFLTAKLPPGEGGVHLDKKNQPYALVIATAQGSDWTIDASHEILEMLVDPSGNRLQTSRSIKIVGKGVQDSEPASSNIWWRYATLVKRTNTLIQFRGLLCPILSHRTFMIRSRRTVRVIALAGILTGHGRFFLAVTSLLQILTRTILSRSCFSGQNRS